MAFEVGFFIVFLLIYSVCQWFEIRDLKKQIEDKRKIIQGRDEQIRMCHSLMLEPESEKYTPGFYDVVGRENGSTYRVRHDKRLTPFIDYLNDRTDVGNG